ncbi:MAG: RNA polymerase sporulation sigma factor SigK [Clostridiales bacterium]|nr:RNA polymerase sporulation sigma factor SigK [Clostridiales bacterium]
MLELLRCIFDGLFCMVLHISGSDSFPPPLSAKAEKSALEKMKSGDDAAKKELIEHNLRLVAHIIKKYYAAYDEQDDLISIGTIGLIKGINTFDCDKGTRLATYAARCIENEILMYFRNQKKSSQDMSMNEPIETDSEGNPLTLMDVMYTEDTIVEDLNRKILSEKVRRYVSEIPDEREKEIVVSRYGLDGSEPRTQREVAKELNISRSYVSRIETRALKNLRKRFKESGK